MFYSTSDTIQLDPGMHSRCQLQPIREEYVDSVHNAIAEEVHLTDKWKNWLSVTQFSMYCTLWFAFLKQVITVKHQSKLCLGNKHFVPQSKKNLEWGLYQNETENNFLG